MKIDYNREEDEVMNNVEITHCQRIKSSVRLMLVLICIQIIVFIII